MAGADISKETEIIVGIARMVLLLISTRIQDMAITISTKIALIIKVIMTIASSTANHKTIQAGSSITLSSHLLLLRRRLLMNVAALGLLLSVTDTQDDDDHPVYII